jgi:hypothetical protein
MVTDQEIESSRRFVPRNRLERAADAANAFNVRFRDQWPENVNLLCKPWLSYSRIASEPARKYLRR